MKQFKHRYIIDGQFQVHPANESKLSLVWKQESEQLFWRKSLSGKIAFTAGCCRGYEGVKDTGMPIVDGWDYIYTGKKKFGCKRFYLDIEKYYDGAWHNVYTGYFTAYDCDWDEDNGVVEAKVITNDGYDCLVQAWDIKYNLYDIVKTQYKIQGDELYSWYELLLADLKDGAKPNCTDIESSYPGVCGYGWICSKGYKIGNKWRNTHIYIRECSRTKINSDFIEDPNSPGIYCRPYDAATAPTFINCGSAYGGANPDPNDPAWGHVQNANGNGDSFWLKYRGFNYYSGLEIPGCLKHVDVMRALAYKLPCGLSGYAKDLFSEITNPVTGEKPNPLNELYVIQKSNVVKFYASNPATVFELSLKDYLKFLKHMFQVYPFIDVNNKLTLKHVSEVNVVTGLDLITLEGGKYINGKKKYSYNRAEMASREEWELGDDTINHVSYDDKCTSPEVIKKYTETQIYTKIKAMQGVDEAGLTGVVFMVADAATGQMLSNNDYLRMRNLVKRYWREERPAIKGVFNNGDNFTANSTERFKQQDELTFPDYKLTFDPMRTILTQLGTGWVKDAEYSLLNSTIKVKLLHDE